MQFLRFTASTARHIHWVEGILATIVAHQKVNYLLTDEQRTLLAEEEKKLRTWVGRLKEEERTRKTFHADRIRELRAQRQVADYICDVTVSEVDHKLRPHREELKQFLPGGFAQLYQGLTLSRLLRSSPDRTASVLTNAADLIDDLPKDQFPAATDLAPRLERAGGQLQEVSEQLEEADRERLRHAAKQHRSEVGLREALQQMNARLRRKFPQAFIESLYPPLDKRSRAAAKDTVDAVDDPESDLLATGTDAA